MTELEKELLFTDLCGRVPYKPMLQIYWEDMYGDGYNNEELASVDNSTGTNMYVNDRWIENVKVYLRPMSSMTEDERKFYYGIVHIQRFEGNYEIDAPLDNPITTIEISRISEVMDWLNEHHFDYRELIEKGLALEASEGMYVIK